MSQPMILQCCSSGHKGKFPGDEGTMSTSKCLYPKKRGGKQARLKQSYLHVTEIAAMFVSKNE